MLKICSFNGSVSVHHRFVGNVNVMLIKTRSPVAHIRVFISSYYEICDILLMYKQLKTVLLCQMGDDSREYINVYQLSIRWRES